VSRFNFAGFVHGLLLCLFDQRAGVSLVVSGKRTGSRPGT